MLEKTVIGTTKSKKSHFRFLESRLLLKEKAEGQMTANKCMFRVLNVFRTFASRQSSKREWVCPVPYLNKNPVKVLYKKCFSDIGQ